MVAAGGGQRPVLLQQVLQHRPQLEVGLLVVDLAGDRQVVKLLGSQASHQRGGVVLRRVRTCMCACVWTRMCVLMRAYVRMHARGCVLMRDNVRMYACGCVLVCLSMLTCECLPVLTTRRAAVLYGQHACPAARSAAPGIWRCAMMPGRMGTKPWDPMHISCTHHACFWCSRHRHARENMHTHTHTRAHTHKLRALLVPAGSGPRLARPPRPQCPAAAAAPPARCPTAAGCGGCAPRLSKGAPHHPLRAARRSAHWRRWCPAHACKGARAHAALGRICVCVVCVCAWLCMVVRSHACVCGHASSLRTQLHMHACAV